MDCPGRSGDVFAANLLQGPERWATRGCVFRVVGGAVCVLVRVHDVSVSVLAVAVEGAADAQAESLALWTGAGDFEGVYGEAA